MESNKSSIFMESLHLPNWPSLPGRLNNSFCYTNGNNIFTALAVNRFGMILAIGIIGFEFVISCDICCPVCVRDVLHSSVVVFSVAAITCAKLYWPEDSCTLDECMRAFCRFLPESCSAFR